MSQSGDCTGPATSPGDAVIVAVVAGTALQGTVLAVGDDESIKVKAKDRVLYDKYAGSTIRVDGEEQLIVKMSDILAVIQ